MKLFSPELVADAAELPAYALVVAAAIGPVFWVLGWRVHRMVFVATATFAGGVYGLVHGPALGLNSVAAAVLLSFSAGGLALALLRIGVFLLCGFVANLAASASIVNHLDETARAWVLGIAFLAGGLLSLVFYRLFVVALTSFIGSFLLLLGGLAFAARQGDADTVELVDARSTLVTAAFIVLGILGIAAQYLLERHRSKERRSRDPTADLIRKLIKTRSAA